MPRHGGCDSSSGCDWRERCASYGPTRDSPRLPSVRATTMACACSCWPAAPVGTGSSSTGCRPGSVLIEDLAFNASSSSPTSPRADRRTMLDQIARPDAGGSFARSEAALDQLWDEPYRAVLLPQRGHRRADQVPTVATFLPLWTGSASSRTADRLSPVATAGFWPRSRSRVCRPTRPQFEAERYWKGPTWINMNWAIVQGLRVTANRARRRTGRPDPRARRAEWLLGVLLGAHRLRVRCSTSSPGPQPLPSTSSSRHRWLRPIDRRGDERRRSQCSVTDEDVLPVAIEPGCRPSGCPVNRVPARSRTARSRARGFRVSAAATITVRRFRCRR